MRILSSLLITGCVAVTALAQVKQVGDWCNCPVCATGGSAGHEGGVERGPRGPSQAQLEARAARERRDKATAFNEKGLAAWNQGQWGIAAEQFRQAYAWNPDSKPILTNLANARFKQGLAAWDEGDWEYSASCFQSAALLIPDSAEFQRHLAMAQQKALEQRAKVQEQREDARRYALAHAQHASGMSATEKGDWTQAEAHFRAAVHLYPAEPAFLKNVAWALTKQGSQAWAQGDSSKALALWRNALIADPQNAYALKTVPLAQKELDAKHQDKRVVARVQGDIHQIAEDVKTNKPASDLELHDYVPDSTSGPLGGKPDVKVTVVPKAKGKTGRNTRAGDQLKSAAAGAGAGDDGRIHFDIGGAPSAGSLIPQTVGAGPRPLDLTTFSARARKDPSLMTMVRDLADLHVKRRQLEAERTHLEAKRNTAPDSAKMQELSDLVAQKAKDYQVNLKAIFDQTERVEKRHRVVDDEEQPSVSSGVRKAQP